MRYFGSSKRNQPVELEPLNPRKRKRYPAPSSEQGGVQSARDGFTRLAQADPGTGIRPSTGGTPVFPPYHEDL